MKSERKTSENKTLDVNIDILPVNPPSIQYEQKIRRTKFFVYCENSVQLVQFKQLSLKLFKVLTKQSHKEILCVAQNKKIGFKLCQIPKLR